MSFRNGRGTKDYCVLCTLVVIVLVCNIAGLNPAALIGIAY